MQNAITTKPGLTYTFEVATDAAFASKVQTKDAVAEGTSGQTGVRLDPTGGGEGLLLARPRQRQRHDRIVRRHRQNSRSGRRIVIDAPVPIAPLTGTQTNTRPALRVTNRDAAGPGRPDYLQVRGLQHDHIRRAGHERSQQRRGQRNRVHPDR